MVIWGEIILERISRAPAFRKKQFCEKHKGTCAGVVYLKEKVQEVRSEK